MYSLHETCQQYFQRRLREGWKCISLKGYNAVLLSPDGIRRPVDLRHGVLTLRPNAAGDETNIFSQNPTSTYHWDKVDEETTDEGTTDVRQYSYADNWRRDLYGLPNHTTETNVINFIKLYFRVRSGENINSTKGAIKTGGTVYETAEKNPYVDFGNWTWGTYSETWTTNPKVGGAWTWTQIDALQIGVALYIHGGETDCTQVYVEVDYTAAPPTVTTQAATDVGTTSCAGNGNITAVGVGNATRRGFCYKVGTSGDPTTADSVAYDDGDFGVGAYTKAITGLAIGTGYRVRGYAVNSGGTGYGATVQVTTLTPTPVADGDLIGIAVIRKS